jgi:hypothetical protein
VVLHIPQVGVAADVVAMSLQEIILGQFEDEGEEHEELIHDVVVDVAREVLDDGTILVDDLRVRPLKLGDEVGDVVDLGVVEDTRVHLPQALGLIPIVLALLQVGTVFEFLLRRQIKHFPAKSELLVYLLLCQAEIDDVEKALGSC